LATNTKIRIHTLTDQAILKSRSGVTGDQTYHHNVFEPWRRQSLS